MRRLRIFISSPGDVQKERQVAQRIIARLAAEFADRVALDPYFWEYEPMRLTAGFQAQIPALPISISSYASCGRGSERRCSIVLAPMGAAGVVAFDWASKAELWRSPNGFPVTTSPVPVKLTQGDAQGVLVAAITGDLWLLSLEDGKPLWRMRTGAKAIEADPVVADLDGNGIPDILIAGYDFSLRAISGLGRLIANPL